MFLAELNGEEKNAFIQLAVFAAGANGEIAREEKDLIQAYCREMAIGVPDLNHMDSLEKVYAVFQKAEKRHQKIALFELLGLMTVDKTYDEKEKAFVSDFVNAVGLTEETAAALEKMLQSYLGMVADISAALG